MQIKKMRKLKSCYKIEITVPESTSEVNFCFRAGENEWDNNSGNNWNWVPGKIANYEYVEIWDTDKAEKKSATKTKVATKTTKCSTAKKTTKAAK